MEEAGSDWGGQREVVDRKRPVGTKSSSPIGRGVKRRQLTERANERAGPERTGTRRSQRVTTSPGDSSGRTIRPTEKEDEEEAETDEDITAPRAREVVTDSSTTKTVIYESS